LVEVLGSIMFPSALIRAVAFIFAATVLPVTGAPFVPQSDNQILEHLPFAPNDPVIRELGALRDRLKNEPHDLPLAVRLAQAYLELGRVTGDLRYSAMRRPRSRRGGTSTNRPMQYWCCGLRSASARINLTPH
jgi:hypothetical protein